MRPEANPPTLVPSKARAIERAHHVRRTAMYDVIVVGARCAGSPTTMLLARKGYRVLLLDKATSRSDTLSSHYLQECAVARLHRWGLLHRLVATGAPPVPTQTFDVGPFALTSSPPSVGALPGFAPRRHVLDKLLLEAAIEGGADVRDAFTVQEVVWGCGARLTS